MNKIVLFAGAATMILLGLFFTLILNRDHFVSWIAVGLGLQWIGVAVRP